MIKPIRVLCKCSLVNGEPFWWDDRIFPPEKRERDNRMIVKGSWYDVVYNEYDSWSEKTKTFTIIDNQGNPHLHFMYCEEDKKNWPSICTDYGPRDYAKWFYTTEELEIKNKREYNNKAEDSSLNHPKG